MFRAVIGEESPQSADASRDLAVAGETVEPPRETAHLGERRVTAGRGREQVEQRVLTRIELDRAGPDVNVLVQAQLQAVSGPRANEPEVVAVAPVESPDTHRELVGREGHADNLIGTVSERTEA